MASGIGATSSSWPCPCPCACAGRRRSGLAPGRAVASDGDLVGAVQDVAVEQAEAHLDLHLEDRLAVVAHVAANPADLEPVDAAQRRATPSSARCAPPAGSTRRRRRRSRPACTSCRAWILLSADTEVVQVILHHLARVATLATRAPLGPCWHHATSCSTAWAAPWARISTEPSPRLRAQPVTPLRSATSRAEPRNQTPCTRPRTAMRTQIVSACAPGRRGSGEGSSSVTPPC